MVGKKRLESLVIDKFKLSPEWRHELEHDFHPQQQQQEAKESKEPTLEDEETAGEIIKTVSGSSGKKKRSISDLAFSSKSAFIIIQVDTFNEKHIP